jgi:hypothetical protein
MELLYDVGHVKSHYGLFRDGARVSVIQVHGLRQM